MISPDGRWVVYVSDISGNPDIYLQSTTGQTPINLTKDSKAADRMPAFSPDGDSIAFRSERDGGGLFVMGRTGESVRRLTKAGFNPSWFPDGQRTHLRRPRWQRSRHVAPASASCGSLTSKAASRNV